MKVDNRNVLYNNKLKRVKVIGVLLILFIITFGVIFSRFLKDNEIILIQSIVGNDSAKKISNEIDETLDITKDAFWNNGTLGVGLFWTDKIEVDESTEGRPINKTLDHNIGVYITNDGKNFTYISETGISGRDPNMIYKNGVFYVATTKGGDTKGRAVFNIFKSTDLINWTNISRGYETDENGDPIYRYAIDLPDNINKLSNNTWSPKWFQDGDDIYLTLAISRFTKEGERLIYIRAKDLIEDYNKSENEREYNIDIVNHKDNNNVNDYTEGYENNNRNCILVKKYKDSENNNIYKYDLYTNSNGEMIKANCPVGDDGTYPIFDQYITKVDFGAEEDQKDINKKNLSFIKINDEATNVLTKINLCGLDWESDENSNDINKYKKYSMLGWYLLKNEEGSATLKNSNNEDITYNNKKYAMYTKQDPFGTLQRWVSDSIVGPWQQIDDGFYISQNINIESQQSSQDTTCTSFIKFTSHDNRFKNAQTSLRIADGYNDKDAYAKHYEGTFVATFGNDTMLYSDHYIIDNESEAGSNDDRTTESVNRIAGIYYSILDKNFDGKTNFGITYDHMRFNLFNKVNTFNTEIRPTASRYNQLRNGLVFSSVNLSDEEKNIFKETLRNATKFNLEPIYYLQSDGKITVVVKSNRAINNKNGEDDEEWVNNGWKYASEMYINKNNYDSNVDKSIRDIYKSYASTTPYGIDEIYLYKTFDAGYIETLKVKDFAGEEKEIQIDTSIPVTDVTLNKTNITLVAGESETLIATILPDNASNKNVTWSSSNDNIAIVDGTGKVEAKLPGTTVITVKTEDGQKEAQCEVNVSGISINDAKVTLEQNNFTYNGEENIANITEIELQDNTKLTQNDYEVSYRNNIDAGEATITITGKGRYTGQVESKFEINPKEIKVTANNKQIHYGEEIPTLDYNVTGEVHQEKAKLEGTLTTEATSKSNVGEYDILNNNLKLIDNGSFKAKNYTIKFQKSTLKIIKATPEYTKPSIIVTIVGKKLKDIDLPEGFSWEDNEETSVGEVGEKIFKCIYTPKDIKNYEIVSDIPVTIKVNKQLELSSENYIIEEHENITYIQNINPKTTLEDLEKKIKTNGIITLYDKDGNETTDKKIKTGMKIRVTTELEEIEYSLVVLGDLTGDGDLNGVDLMKLARYMAKLDTDLKGAYYQAANVHRNSNDKEQVNNADLLKMARVLAQLEDF